MKKRLLFFKLEKNLPHKNALVITGMRQVGKTTLMRQLHEYLNGKPRIWFDFDNPLDQKFFEDIEYRNIYSKIKQNSEAGEGDTIYVFIDEIQNFPEITKIIKFLIDHYGIKFIVTGSSNFYLKNLFPESLSGRKFLFELPPLSFKEYLYFKNKLSAEEAMQNDIVNALKPIDIIDFKKVEQDYEDYLKFGGFPEAVVTENIETKTQILKNIFASFFEKDLKILSDYKDIRELRDLILLLVPRVGSMLDVSKIASELEIARPKVYNYLLFLQGTFIIRLLPKFSKSIDRSVAGGKKVYFTDTGILNTIGKVNDAQLFENAVINQLAGYGNLSFYHKRDTAEIDSIINGEFALEVKLKGTEKDLYKLKNLTDKIGIKEANIVSKTFVEKKGFISAVAL